MNIRKLNILGLDWGERKIGVAVSSGSLADPVAVIRYKHTNKLFRELKSIIKEYKIEKIIVGISEGQSELAAKNFAKVVEAQLKLPVATFDETLSSFDAQQLSIQAHTNRKKRKELEDAFAAAVMLQNYLDNS